MVLENCASILSPDEILFTLEIYRLLTRRSQFAYLPYMMSPLTYMLANCYINSLSDEIIFRILEYVYYTKFKKPEYLGELFHFCSIATCHFLEGVKNQKKVDEMSHQWNQLPDMSYVELLHLTQYF
jgi:hypothetical protein